MNGIEVLNDVVRKMGKVYQLEAKDTSEMTEKQLDAYNAQMKEAIVDMLGQFAAARGIPLRQPEKAGAGGDRLDGHPCQLEQGGRKL